MAQKFGGFKNITSVALDDSVTNRIDGSVSTSLQQYLEQIDKAQDLDDSTHFRPENVLSAIAFVTSATPDGWHLNTSTDELVKVSSGAIADTYSPKLNDTIKLGSALLSFNGRNWQYVEYYRSPELNYINGSSIVFAHGWNNFDPNTEFYQAQAWAVCIVNQNGWTAGERIKVERRATISIDDTNIYLQVGANGISSTRKNGNLNEFSLNANNWQIYVTAIRRVD